MHDALTLKGIIITTQLLLMFDRVKRHWWQNVDTGPCWRRWGLNCSGELSQRPAPQISHSIDDVV